MSHYNYTLSKTFNTALWGIIKKWKVKFKRYDFIYLNLMINMQGFLRLRSNFLKVSLLAIIQHHTNIRKASRIISLKNNFSWLPWWSSGYDSMFPLQWAQVQTLVGKLRFLMPHGVGPPTTPKKTRQKMLSQGDIFSKSIELLI